VKRMMSALLGLCFVGIVQAQTLAVNQLFAFPCQSGLNDVCPDGARPTTLIQAADGNFYGVTQTSLDSHSFTQHPMGGTIFKLTASGKLTLLYTFQRNPTTGFYDQGSYPAALTEGSDGFLYGAAGNGGPTAASAGTIFKISKSGTGFQVLETFCTTCVTGGFPNNLVAGTDGNMYGTTSAGGAFACQGLGCGVVFKLTPPGTYTVLHSFNGTTDTQVPLGVIQASDGNLYGTTSGTITGTIFRVNPSSGQFTTIYTFPSGVHSVDVATQASNRLLYGASRSSSNSGPVTVYSSTLGGTVQNLVTISFGSAKKIGIGPFLQASDGNLWSTSSAGGTSSQGVVFAISFSGTIVQQLSLDGTKGAQPVAGVIQTSNGTLYLATTALGTDSSGNKAFGTVATITGLPPR